MSDYWIRFLSFDLNTIFLKEFSILRFRRNEIKKSYFLPFRYCWKISIELFHKHTWFFDRCRFKENLLAETYLQTKINLIELFVIYPYFYFNGTSIIPSNIFLTTICNPIRWQKPWTKISCFSHSWLHFPELVSGHKKINPSFYLTIIEQRKKGSCTKISFFES